MVLQALHTLGEVTAYNYQVTTTSTGSSVAWGMYFLVLLAIWAVSIVAFWKVFVKAGKPGWASIVPIYNGWVFFEIAGKPGWWVFSFLLSVIPVVGWIVPLVLYVIATLEIAKRFSKSTTFAIVGMIIFSLIGYIMLGFGDDKYDASKGTPPKAATPTTA